MDLGAKKTESGRDYLSINPKGAVPALELDMGDVLTENAIVLQYLADKAPQSGLMVANGMARWHFLELVNFSLPGCTKALDLFGTPLAPKGARQR